VQAQPLSPDQALDMQREHVVVSFIQYAEEVEQPGGLELSAAEGVASSTMSHPQRCTVCNAPRATLEVPSDPSVRLCGRACYEFRYVFGERTAYR
jgi:hypothetical protein